MKLERILRGAALSAALAGMGGAASAAVEIDATLPYPGDETGAEFGTFTDNSGIDRPVILLDGIPIAFKYDDYWSYALPLLDQMQDAGIIPLSFGDYNPTGGVGANDAVIFSQSGAKNKDVGADKSIELEQAADTIAGNTYYIETWWGQADQDNDGNPDSNPNPSDQGPNTVGEILDYLHTYNPDQDTPVFVFDWNQEGGEDSILAAFQVLILDDVTGDEVAQWSLDSVNDSMFDATKQVLNFGDVCFAPTLADCGTNFPSEGYLGAPDSGETYVFDLNTGSGRDEFAVFAPTMDLGALDPNDLFVVHLVLGCETGIGLDQTALGLGCGNNGGEEGFLTGRLQTPEIPEPAVIALLGLGLVGLGFQRRKDA